MASEWDVVSETPEAGAATQAQPQVATGDEPWAVKHEEPAENLPDTNFLGMRAPIQWLGREPDMVRNTQAGPPTTAAGVAGAVTRGLAPITAGAAAGAGIGSLVGGVGAIPGAAAGAGAVALTELFGATYDTFADALGLPKIASPQGASDAALTAIGVAQPQSRLERTVEAGVGGAGNAVGASRAANVLSGTMTNPVARGVANAMGENTAQQAASGLQAGAASQAASELGANDPLSQTIVSLAAGAGPYASRPETQQAATQPKGRAAAIARVETRLAQDVKGTGTSAQQVVDDLTKARGMGKPMGIGDTGPNVRSLTGDVARQPGESMAIARKNLNTRDEGAGKRISDDISRDLQSGGSTWRTAQALSDQRVADSKPLFDSAFAGGSTAPLKDQFAEAYVETSNRVQFAARAADEAKENLRALQIKYLPDPDIYSNLAKNRELRAAQAAAEQTQRDLTKAMKERDDYTKWLQQARDDIAINRPGAVWSPKIQRLIQNPIMRRGLAHGRLEEQVTADTEDRPYHFTEADFDEDGNLIRVPTMQILASGKEGLDGIIEAEGRDEFGRLNKWGTKVYLFQKELLNELDRLNPDYAEARQMWSGYSASRDALKWGQNIARRDDPDQIAAEFSDMTNSDKEFARLGLANDIRMRVLSTSVGGDESKRLLNDEWQRLQYLPLFKSREDFDRLVYSLQKEREMFDTKQAALGGSQTQARQAESQTNQAIRTGSKVMRAISFLPRYPARVISGALDVTHDLRLHKNQDVNAEIARILTDISYDLFNVDGELAVRPPGPLVNPSPLGPSAAAAAAMLGGQMARQDVPE